MPMPHTPRSAAEWYVDGFMDGPEQHPTDG